MSEGNILANHRRYMTTTEFIDCYGCEKALSVRNRYIVEINNGTMQRFYIPVTSAGRPIQMKPMKAAYSMAKRARTDAMT